MTRHRMLLAALLVAGCRSSSGGGSRTVVVTALGGERPEPGATVIGHSPNGDIIDQTTADAVGIAEVGVDDDSFISVVFPGTITSVTPVLSIVTAPAPDAELVVHGPARGGSPPLVVGVLQVDGPNLQGADHFEIRHGCATVRATRLPATADIGACSMGSDTALDVIVSGYQDLGGDPPAPQLVAYAAARVPMLSGVATLAIDAWQTGGVTVPVTLDGVAPRIELVLYADGLPLDTRLVTGDATLATGLVVDATRIEAGLAGVGTARITTRWVTGAPPAIALSAADFLPPIDVTAAVAALEPLSITFAAAGVGDAVNLRATWELTSGASGVVPVGPHRVVWDAVLPPDAARATLPRFTGDLAKAIVPVAAPADVLVRYVDSVAHDGFTALVAAGIHAEDTQQASTIAPRPTDGDLRVTHAIGVR